MKPVYSWNQNPVGTYYIFLEETVWKAMLDQKKQIPANIEILKTWQNKTEEERKDYEKSVEHIQTEDQLNEYLKEIKDQVYKKSNNRKEIQRISNVIQKKRIAKKQKK